MRLCCLGCKRELHGLGPPTLRIWVWCGNCKAFARYPSRWQLMQWELDALLGQVSSSRLAVAAVLDIMKSLTAPQSEEKSA